MGSAPVPPKAFFCARCVCIYIYICVYAATAVFLNLDQA